MVYATSNDNACLTLDLFVFYTSENILKRLRNRIQKWQKQYRIIRVRKAINVYFSITQFSCYISIRNRINNEFYLNYILKVSYLVIIEYTSSIQIMFAQLGK